MILTCLPNISWNLLNNCLFYLFLLCFGQTTGPFSADAASTGVQNQVVCCHSTMLLLCLKHPLCPPRCVHTHRTATCRHTRTRIPVVSRGTSHRWHGQTWKAPRYLKIEQSTDVQLTPDTFRKLAPHPLPACSTQATFQCLLLYLPLELQYYCEASGRLLLLMPPKHTVRRSLLLRQHHCKQFKCERSLHCHHFSSVIRKSFHLSSDDNCRYLLTAITCL